MKRKCPIGKLAIPTLKQAFGRSRWFQGFALTAALLVESLAGQPVGETLAQPSTGRPDLTGIVCQADGQPLEDASIFIYTARPRQGLGFT